MVWYEAFGSGVVGAFVVYAMLYRDTRFTQFTEAPFLNWRVLAFDLIVYLLCGGLVTAFWIEPASPREAFMAGCTWQGLVGGVLAGTEMKTLNRYARKGQRGK